MTPPQPEKLYLEGDEATGFPNSPLPVLLYRNVVDHSDSEDCAREFEAMFEQNGWPPSWRYHLYDFQHFHTNAHEALGVFRGQARAQLGGPNGPEVTLEAGDVLVLPAGTGHACLEDSDGFCMVGAYPPNQASDLERGDPARLEAAQKRIAAVTLPAGDPIGGTLSTLWKPTR
ncbi:cupin domain-containing protein [Vreelandella sp. TE19]